ncbi:hypothetical protein JCM11641_002196 [Rhodosporidiobolus odoratus]
MHQSLQMSSSDAPAGQADKTTAERRRSSVRRPSIAADKLGPMKFSKGHAPGAQFNIVFVGAGNINFGSDEGPWDHSFRLENRLGPRLKVVAIIDPVTSAAEARLKVKRNSFVETAYRDTRICTSLDDFCLTMKDHERPHAFIVGSPAAFRGSTQQGRDFELQVLKKFPENTPAMFIEKPLSADSVENALQVSRALVDSKTVVSVGYFLRYLKVVQKMRSIIEDNDLEVMATVARYVSSYANINKPAWWMKSKDCGPKREQRGRGSAALNSSRARAEERDTKVALRGIRFFPPTLAASLQTAAVTPGKYMYFGGDVDMDTVQAQALEHDEPAGQLAVVPIDEDKIQPDDRIPRVTSAHWKYETGAVGSLTHALVLQGYKYSVELEIYADGYQLRLIDPYNAPELRVRTPDGDEEQVYTFERDDPYAGELNAFIDETENAMGVGSAVGSAVADDDSYEILSSFEDAAKTYALSWAIRVASEQNTKKFKKTKKASQ